VDYKDDNVWLMYGDCLERMKEIPDGSVDMVLTDPPYGTIACKWDSVIPLEPMWEQLKRITKPNGAIVMTASQPFTSILGASNLGMLKYSWVWEKGRPTNFPNAKRMPLKGFEDILVFYKKQPVYHPQGTTAVNKVVKNTGTKTRSGSLKENGDRTSVHNDMCKHEEYTQTTTGYPRGIVKFTQDSNSLHPTQKPVALMEYLINTYTNEGETVLDFTAGSFTTGVACVNTNRKFIGIEMDENYFNVGKNRLLKGK
jgi:site-specific DNA-methyltransferase (adenine-specific)